MSAHMLAKRRVLTSLRRFCLRTLSQMVTSPSWRPSTLKRFSATSPAQQSKRPTLAAGTRTGQIKRFLPESDGGATVCTPADRLGYADLNCVGGGDPAMLMWTGTAWAIIGFADVGADIPADLIDIA